MTQTIQLTPTSISIPTANGDTVTNATANPLDTVFGTKFDHLIERGASVSMAAGLYPAPTKPIVQQKVKTLVGAVDAKNQPVTTIDRGTQDTLMFGDPTTWNANGGMHLMSLTILGSWRSAIMFAGSSVEYYNDFFLSNVEIDGGWDHSSGGPTKPGLPGSKWGICGHMLNAFRFKQVTIHDVRHEHGVYLHNLGPIQSRFDGCTIRNVGRCAVQSVSRREENNGEANGRLLVKNSQAIGTSLVDGGFGFTFAHLKELVLANVDWMATDYSTHGALLVWPEYGNPLNDGANANVMTGGVGISNFFATGSPAVKSSLVRLSAIHTLAVEGLRLTARKNPLLLELDPPGGGMAGDKFPTREIVNGGDHAFSFQGENEQQLPVLSIAGTTYTLPQS